MTVHKQTSGRRVAETGHLLLNNATGSRVRSAATIRRDIDLLAEELHYTFFMPAATCLGEELSGTRRHFVQLGFSISVPEQCKIEWLRYEVAFFFPVLRGTEVELSEADPRLVHSPLFGIEDLMTDVPLYLSDSGMTSAREQSVHILGFFPNKNIVCWDFIPVDGKSLAGCESLSIKLRERKLPSVSVTQVLHAQTFTPSPGKLMFQCRSAKIQILGGNRSNESHSPSFDD